MDLFLNAWDSFANGILSALPDSPTIDNAALEALSRYAGYINYFLPVGAYMTFLLALLGAVGSYYAVVVILRWLKLVD